MKLEALQKALAQLATQDICPVSMTFEDHDFQSIAHEIRPGQNAYSGFQIIGPIGRVFINTNTASNAGSKPVTKEERPAGINAAFPCKYCDEIDLVGFPEHVCTGFQPVEKDEK